jgi:hypothetical protein
MNRYLPLRIVGLFLGLWVPFSVGLRSEEQERLLPEVPWRDTKDLAVEEIGAPLGIPVVKLLPLMERPADGSFIQPLWYRANGRQIYFVTLNLATGDFKRHPTISAYQIWRAARHDGKLYLGFNLPSFLGVYDPATDTLTNLGEVSEKASTVFRVKPGPDGTVALGLANGSTEVTLYDPRIGKFRSYGSLSAKHGYVYTLGHTQDFLYAALRGKVPWQLVAVNKKTGAEKVLLEAPVKGYLKVSGNWAKTKQEYSNKEEAWVHYRLEGDRAVEAEPPPKGSGAGVEPPPMPEVLLDDVSGITESSIDIYYRLPADRPEQDDPKTTVQSGGWKVNRLKIGVEGKGVTRLLRWDENTIIGSSGPYGPMFRYDIKKDEMKVLGLPTDVNVYSGARKDDRLYISGYPTTAFASVDVTAPFTSPKSIPGRAGIEWKNSKANPRLIDALGNLPGMNSHCGVAMAPGADGRIYICAMRFRYFRGFALAFYDPKTGKYGKVNDGGRLRHFQVSWMAPVDGGKRLAIATRVQPNSQEPGEPFTAAKIFIFNTSSGKFEKDFTPFPEEKILASITEAKDGTLIGLVTEERYPKQSRTTIYKFDWKTGKVLRTNQFGGVITGISNKHQLPRKGPSFVAGPDGFIWTAYKLPYASSPYLLLRIDPGELTLHPLGRITGSPLRFEFVGKDIYFAGAERLRRITNVVQ